MSEDIKYYLNLPYDIHIETDSEDGKPVYYAYILELGKHAWYGKGYTREEALKSLDEAKKDIIEYSIENNKPIPEPSRKIDEELPSGKFIVRTNPIIHKQLLDQSKEIGISFNLLVNQLLVRNSIITDVKNLISEKFKELFEDQYH